MSAHAKRARARVLSLMLATTLLAGCENPPPGPPLAISQERDVLIVTMPDCLGDSEIELSIIGIEGSASGQERGVVRYFPSGGTDLQVVSFALTDAITTGEGPTGWGHAEEKAFSPNTGLSEVSTIFASVPYRKSSVSLEDVPELQPGTAVVYTYAYSAGHTVPADQADALVSQWCG